MLPLLYDKTGQNLIGTLTDCSRGIVIEERNGMFEAEIDYQLFSPCWDSLVRGNIIVADANDKLKNQKFRIYKVTKNIYGKFSVYAKHISYDIARDRTEGLSYDNASCEYALNELFRLSHFSQGFTGYSDIINAQAFSIGATNLLTAIVGEKGSIIDTYGNGADILRDNYDFHVLNSRGADNGVTIEYASNMTGLNYEEDEDGLITRIRAIAKYTDDNQEEVIVVVYVDSPYINNYETPFISEIDFTQSFEENEIPNVENLTELAEAYFENNRPDVMKFNYKIEFIPLSKCVGYENIEDEIELCDTVRIVDYRYGLDTKAKVIKYTYDFLRERYESMELGEPRSTLGDIINDNKGVDGIDGAKGEKGEDGISVTDIQEQYYLSTSKEEPTGNIWSSTQPTFETGYYLWTRLRIVYSDNSTVFTTPVCDTSWEAIEDTKEQIENTIVSVDILYYLSSSANSLLDGEWLENVEWSQGWFLWTKTVYTYNNGNIVETEPQLIVGEIESDFPDTVPDSLTLTATSLGLASIQLNWTFEGEVYYQYELYSSTTKDFTPNEFDLIYKGQASSFLYQLDKTQLGQTFYFRVCCINTHGTRSEFSEQVEVETTKEDDLSNYFSDMAIGTAVVGSLTADYMTAGIIQASWIDIRNLSVTDGNGKRTLDIDSYGHIMITHNNNTTTSIGENGISQTKLYNGTSVNGSILQNGGLIYYNRDGSSTCGVVSSVYSDSWSEQIEYGMGFYTKSGSSLAFGISDSIDEENPADGNFTRYMTICDTDLTATDSTAKVYGQGVTMNKPLYCTNQMYMYDFGINLGFPNAIWFGRKASDTIADKPVICGNGNIYMLSGSTSYEIIFGYNDGVNFLSDNTWGKINSSGHWDNSNSTGFSHTQGSFWTSDATYSGVTYLKANGTMIYTAGGWVNFTSTAGAFVGLRCDHVRANSAYSTSDKRLKTDIKYIGEEQTLSETGYLSPNVNISTSDMYEFIETLPLASYRFISDLNKGKDATHYGFIAQDVLYSKVGSELVELPRDEYGNEIEDGYLSYNSNNFVTFICGALQEVIKKINELENKLN